jgi:hypothetical protein
VGTYTFQIRFSIAGFHYLQKQQTIALPPAAVTFSTPGKDVYNVTEPVFYQVTNNGGQRVMAGINLYLEDHTGTIVHQRPAETHNLFPNASNQLVFTFPETLKTGTYQLISEASASGEPLASTLFPITVNGLYAQLNAYTLKQKYVADELVTGRAEIEGGLRPLQGGTLEARILKL